MRMTNNGLMDHAHMTRALEIAERGRFTTKPNPVVGCLIVKGSEVIAEGWHERAGDAHAEVNALQAAGEAARDAFVRVVVMAEVNAALTDLDVLVEVERHIHVLWNPRAAGDGSLVLQGGHAPARGW